MLKDSTVDTDVGPPSAAGTSLSTSLLVRLRARDPDAWRRLAALFGPEVYRWCRRAGLGPEDAADVGQEVFRAVDASLSDFRRDRPGDSFRGWLWTITRNKLRDFWRRPGGWIEAVGGSHFLDQLAQVPDDPESTLDAVGPATSDGLVPRALELVRSEFEQKTWRAFRETAVEGRPAAEVARELGISTNAVYVARSRVLARLREELGPLIC